MNKNKAIEDALSLLKPFLPAAQVAVVRQGLRGEEKDFFASKMIELAGTVQATPQTYGQQGATDPIAHLHYFTAGSDFWITEKDMEAEQVQAFGFACLGGDAQNAELGYISIEELLRNGAELDFHFPPTPLSSIKEKAGCR